MGNNLGFVGAGGAAGVSDALREIIADRIKQKLMDDAKAQQEFENRMQVRSADTGDARFDRTQDLSEELGRGGLEVSRGGLDVSRGNLGLSRERFGHEQNQDFRGNRIEDEDRTREAGEREGRVNFLEGVAGEQADPVRRNAVRGLRYNVNLPDLRTPEQRGTEAGTEEGAAFDAGGRRVRQATVDMGTRSGIAQANAAADRKRADAAGSPLDVEAQETAAEVTRLAGLLRKHPGRDGAFGVVNARLPTLRQDTADAEALLASLQGLLTLDNMEKMKGVLSDNDMKILRAASTTLSGSMSQGAAEAELMRLEQLGGAKTPANAPGSETPAERAARLRKTYGGGR